MERRRRAAPQGARVHAPAPRAPASAHTFAIEAWLTRHWQWMLLVLVAASLGVRSVYFLQLKADPAIDLHRWTQSDMNYYDAWGRQIAHGDWLSASVTVPMHLWQREVAGQYLSDHPEMRATLLEEAKRSGAGSDADALLWSRWMGGHQFYEDPLYPYLIGLTYRLFGDDVRFVFAWQMAFGVMSNVLIWLLAWRFFGPVVAACAGALAVLSAPLMYYELILLRETGIVFAGLGLVWLTDRALTRGHWAWFALLGACLGLACLLKSSFVLLGGGVIAGIVAHFRFRWRGLWVPVAATTAGLAIVLIPLVARNRALDVPPLALASSGGLTFMISNDIDYNPQDGFKIDAPRLAGLLGESGGGLLPAVIATLRPHTISSYGTLLWRKWDRAWYWFEIPNNENFYYMRLRAPVLAWLPVTFWLCSPLALAGLTLGMSRPSRVWLLYLLVVCCLIPLLVFYVLGRFRPPLMAAVIPFAALSLVEFVRWVGNRRYRRVGLGVAAILILASWTGRALQGQPLIRDADWRVPFSARYQSEAQAALAAHNPAAAASAYLEFFRYEPDLAQLMSPPDPTTLLMLGEMHTHCASLLREAGRAAEAKEQVDKAGVFLRPILKMDPSNVEVGGLLADALLASQSYEDAAVYYRGYLQYQPNNPSVLSNFGIALTATGKADEALRVFRRAVEIQPMNGEAQQNLANALFDNGHFDEAAEHAERAVALRPDAPTAHDVLGRARAMQGKFDAARAEFERSLRIDPTYAEAREHLQKVPTVRSPR